MLVGNGINKVFFSWSNIISCPLILRRALSKYRPINLFAPFYPKFKESAIEPLLASSNYQHIPTMKTLLQYLIIFSALSSAATGVAVAGERIVYKGTLGTNTEVVLELEKKSASYEGRYFYLRFGVDIPLQGTLAALKEALPKEEHGKHLDTDDNSDPDLPIFIDPVTKKPRSVWQGEIKGDTYQGTWHNAKTKKNLPFKLHQVGRYDPDAINPEGVEAITIAVTSGVGSGIADGTTIALGNAPYEYLKMQFPLLLGPEILRKNVGYRMVTDPRTRFAYPRLTRHPNPQVLAGSNQLLEQRHWQMSLAALSCMATLYAGSQMASGDLGSYDSEKIGVRYLSETLMTVVESGSTYCGGAHPNNHYDPFTLDLIHGDYLDFNRLFPTQRSHDNQIDLDPVLVSFISEKMKSASNRASADMDSDLDTECNDVLLEYLAIEFDEPDKISFVVSGIGHAMGACLGPRMVIPISALKPILKPGAEAYFQN